MSEIRTDAVREFQHNEDADDCCVEEIRRVGYTIVDSGFSPDELQDIREKIDEIYDRQVRQIGDLELSQSFGALSDNTELFIDSCSPVWRQPEQPVHGQQISILEPPVTIQQSPGECMM